MPERIRRAAPATVTDIRYADASIERLEVEADLFKGTAINYPLLTGRTHVGDEVIINTTAVELGLGTGGVHFVIANLSRQSLSSDATGHIMKLRYSPHQKNVLCVEEAGHPDHALVAEFESLQGKPVILGMLHSMIAPAAAGLRVAYQSVTARPVQIAYIMTDSAALPLAFSDLARKLTAAKVIDMTITCGQTFGGDRETVNIYTALAAASDADAIIIAPGPGHLGTATRFGFSGIEQGHHIDVVNQLGGKPIVIPRISFTDARKRHRGLSHHSVTILTRACCTRSQVVIPRLPQDQFAEVQLAIQQHGIDTRHEIVVEEGTSALAYLRQHSIAVKSMGRTPADDPAYFLAAGAAGIYVGRLIPS